MNSWGNNASTLKEKFNDRIHFVKCNIKNSDSIASAIESAQRHFGTIEVLVNNCCAPLPGLTISISYNRKELVRSL